MITLILSLLFLFYLLVRLRNENNSCISPVFILIFLFFASLFCSLILVSFGLHKLKSNVDYNSAGVYFILLFFIFIFPLISYNKQKETQIPSNKSLNLLAIGCTILSFFSLAYFSLSAVNVLEINLIDIADTRHLIAQGENLFISKTIFNTIAGVSASLYTFQLLLFYVFLIKNKIKIACLILLSSFSYVVFVFCYLGRDGFLFWILSFIFFLSFFRRSLSIGHIKILYKILKITGAIFLVFFALITIGRFVYTDSVENYGAALSILSYFGQGWLNFAESFGLNLQMAGNGIFPLFFDENSLITNVNRSILFSNDLQPWLFRTFIGSFYLEFQAIGTLVIACVFSCVFYLFNGTRKKAYRFSSVIVFTLYITIFSQGLFYFRQYNNVGNLYIIIMLGLAFFFKLIENKRHT